MPDQTTATTPPAQKPGYLTTEFWSHMLVQIAVALITFLLHNSAALPPIVGAVLTAIGPLAMVWLQSQYSEDRSAVKMALAAGQSAAKAPQAGAGALGQ